MTTTFQSSTHVKEYDNWIDLYNNYIFLRIDKFALKILQIKVDAYGKAVFGKNILLEDSDGLHASGKKYNKQAYGRQTYYGCNVSTTGSTVRSVATHDSIITISHLNSKKIAVNLHNFDIVMDKEVLARESWVVTLGEEFGFSLTYESQAVVPLEYLSLKCLLKPEYSSGKIQSDLTINSLLQNEDYYFPMPPAGPSVFAILSAEEENGSMAIFPNDGDRVHLTHNSNSVILNIEHGKLKGIASDSRVFHPIESGSNIIASEIKFVFHEGKNKNLLDEYERRYAFPEIKLPDRIMRNAINCAWHLDLVPNIWRDDSIMVCLRRGGGYYNFTPDIWLPSQALLWSSNSYPREVVKNLLLKLSDNQNSRGQFPWAFNDTGPRYDDYKAGQLKSGYLEVSANCLAIVQTLNYYRWTGDIDVIDHVMPSLRKGISHLSDGSSERVLLGEDGILHTTYPFVDWRDWVYARNKVSLVNVLYYWALTSLADIEEAIKSFDLAQIYRQQAKDIKESINSTLWRDNRGYYVGWVDNNNVEHDKFEIDTNSLAVFLGIADGDKATSILDFFIKHDNEMGVVPVRWCYPQWVSSGVFDYDEKVINPNSECMPAWDNGEAGGWGRLAWSYIHMWKKAGEYKHAYEKVKAYADVYMNNPHIMESYHIDGKGFSQYGYAENAAALLCTVMDTVLGLEPDLIGLKIDPIICSEWTEISITGLVYRDAVLDIKIDNNAGILHGVKEFYIDGKLQGMNIFPAAAATGHHELKIIMGL